MTKNIGYIFVTIIRILFVLLLFISNPEAIAVSICH